MWEWSSLLAAASVMRKRQAHEQGIQVQESSHKGTCRHGTRPLPMGEMDVSRAITAVQPGLDSMTLVRCSQLAQHRVALDDLENEFLQTLAD